MKNYKADSCSAEPVRQVPASDLPVIDVASLMGEHREILLAFEGEIYRLRITSKGKLIMTK